MPRRKKPVVELKVIEITYTCNDKLMKVEVKDYAFSAADDECELCGSHGYIKVEIYCPNCNQCHDIDLKSW